MCDFRQNREQWEWTSLAPYAAHSTDPSLYRRRSLGDRYDRWSRSERSYSPWPPEEPEIPSVDDLPGTMSRYKTAFQIDKERITKSTAFRRLEYKTQVFISHEGDHYRTRLTHTIEVCETARLIAQALQLNEDLVEAIALGHDLGHTPIGHVGEETLNELFKMKMERYKRVRDDGRTVGGAFFHNVQGVRVVDTLEKGYEWDRRKGLHDDGSVGEYDPEDPPDKKGYGMDLCWAVREGILKHTDRGLKHDDPIMYGSEYLLDDLDYRKPATLEGQVVEFADEIASMMHDIEDGIRSRGFSIRDFRIVLRKELTKLGITGHPEEPGLYKAFGLSSDFFHFNDKYSKKRKKSRLAKMSLIASEILDLKKECTVGHIIGFLRTLFISNLIEASYTRLMEALIGAKAPKTYPDHSFKVKKDDSRLLVVFSPQKELTNMDGLPRQAWELHDPFNLRPEAWILRGDGSREKLKLADPLRLYWVSRSIDQSERTHITVTDGKQESGFTFPLERVCVIFDKVKIIGYSPDIADLSKWLRKIYIRDNLHCSPIVIRNGEKGRLWMKSLFRRYLEAPLCLPRSTLPKYGIKITKEKNDRDYMTGSGTDRRAVKWDKKCVLRVIEHLQGMTDRYLGEEYARFFLDENKMSENEEIAIVDTESGPFLLLVKK